MRGGCRAGGEIDTEIMGGRDMEIMGGDISSRVVVRCGVQPQWHLCGVWQ